MSREDVTRLLTQIDMDEAVIDELRRQADAVRPVLVDVASGRAGEADTYMRKNAIALLGAVGDESSVDALVEVLDEDDATLRANAIRSLGSIESPRAAAGLVRHLARAELTPTEGKLVVKALGAVGGPESVRAVEDFRARFAKAKEASPGLERDLRQLDDVLTDLRSR